MSAFACDWAALAFVLAAAPLAAEPSGPSVHRLALVVGANRGARDRIPLRYAVTDAERFAQVLTRMGGVRVQDSLLLREPTRQAFDGGLAAMRLRARNARSGGARVDVMLYFSGHADDRGLMLGREVVPYAELRTAIGEMNADVGITILDACASGAITRLKGGDSHPAFLTAGSGDVRGYAFLTSSSENEAAQESERLQGSFFTHALLTGLRGAADTSGDGMVSLGEAYQFAFGETLSQTTATQAGAQHPAYDIKMSGSGDVVLTDVRETASTLVLGPEYDGRFFVLNTRRQLVAELYKTHGRQVELGLEPGEYDVYFEQGQQLLASSLRLEDGQRRELARQELRPSRRQPTRRRGGEPGSPGRDLLDGRTRGQFFFGLSRLHVVESGPTEDPLQPGESVDVDVSAGVSVTHWLRRDLALEFTLAGFDMRASLTPEDERTRVLMAPLFGLRYYLPLAGSVRPYLGAAVGPFIDVADTKPAAGTPTTTTEIKGGGVVGGGVELFLWRRTTLSLDARVTLVSGRSADVPVTLGLGWTFGRGRP